MDTFKHAFIIAEFEGWASLRGFHGLVRNHERGKARQSVGESRDFELNDVPA